VCSAGQYMYHENPENVVEELSHHLGAVSEILFFLLGAMTIVELVDAHHGFKVITDRITTKDSRTLLWVLSIITFFLSAILDNLTTSIVMVSLLRKLISDQEQRKFYAGMVIIAANAGGAWSPIGDVTTTMLWIGGQISSIAIITQLIVPSLVCLLIPLLVISLRMKGNLKGETLEMDGDKHEKSKLMLLVGVGGLIFVPIFKTVTHLPPYMGMLLSLGIVWITSELINSDKDEEERHPYTPAHALSRIDTSSVLFFLGILVAIGALEATHLLTNLAEWMSASIGNLDIIVFAIGIASAVIDNVPLVAATMGMYDMTAFPQDSKLWEFLAYCAGTGGSILIIGSAAGVAVMGMEKIDFVWYIKRISLLAFIGYVAGALTYLGIYSIIH
jgi:Na+/H+ antiporter NhaD/arsenite permease-like protein